MKDRVIVMGLFQRAADMIAYDASLRTAGRNGALLVSHNVF